MLSSAGQRMATITSRRQIAKLPSGAVQLRMMYPLFMHWNSFVWKIQKEFHPIADAWYDRKRQGVS